MKNTSLKHQFILIIGLSLLLHLIILVLFLLFSRYQHYKDSTKLAYEKQMEHGKEKVKREVLQMYNIIDFELEIYKQNVKKRIMERAYEGYSIAWSIFNKYKNEKSEAEIKAMIVSALHNVRFFNGRGYYFINDMDANVVMSPIMPEEVGNSYINTTEVDNKSVLKKIITTVNKQKEGFITYKTYLPESELPTTNSYYKKISFVKLFEPFNWIIGTGDYRYGNIIELKDKVIKMINRRKYGVNGYFFVYDFNGLCLSLPADRSREYSNLIGMKDVTGESVIKKAISIASKGGGFMTWYFKSLVEDKPLKKIGYIKGVDELNIWFGTGIYVDEISSAFAKQLEAYKNITARNSAAILLTLVFVYVIIYLLTRKLVTNLSKDIDLVSISFDKALKDDKLIEKNITKMNELQSLIDSFNNTLRKKHLFNRIAQEKKRQFATLFEKSAEPMLILNKNGFIDCNNAALAFLGYTEKGNILKHPSKISPDLQLYGKTVKYYDEVIKELYETKGAKSFEWIHFKSDGTHIYVATMLTFIEPQDFIFCTWRDITKRVVAENELLNEKNKLATMLESIKDGVVIVDLDCSITYVNAAFLNITGYNKKEILFKNFDELLSFYDLSTTKADSFKVAYVLASRKSYTNLHGQRIITKEGIERIISKAITPILNEKNELTGAVITLRDITENVIFQQKKARYENLHSIAIFTGSMAHEFNNILTGILTNAYLAKKISESSNVHNFITKIEEAVLEATKTTNKLLKYTETGDLQKGVTSLFDMIKDTADFVFAESEISVNVNYDDNVWEIEIDKVKISQLLNNIFVNAKQSIDGNNGKVAITVENVKLDDENHYSLKNGRYVKIRVKDNGRGIPAKWHDKIFEPYFTTKKHNSGIGLFRAKNIAVNHGGTVKLINSDESGTSFDILLPAFEIGDALAENFSNKEKELKLDKLRFLIIEKNDIERESLKSVLEFLGNYAETAASFPQAGNILSENDLFNFYIVGVSSEDEKEFSEFLNFHKDVLADYSVVVVCELPKTVLPDALSSNKKINKIVYKPLKMAELENIVKFAGTKG